MNRTQFLGKYGPWAVVTGASEGIGRAFASELAALKINLCLVARRKSLLDQLARECERDHGVQTHVIDVDLSTSAGRLEASRRSGSEDVGLLVAAAGFGTSGPLTQANLEDERSMLEVNCLAALEQCVDFGNRFVKRGKGGIILMSSLLAWQGVPRAAHYAATKAYIQSLAEGLYLELRPLGVDVLASAPGPVASGFARRADMRMGASASPRAVALGSLRALAKQSTVVPGGFSKFLTYSLLPLPRPIRTRILASIMGSMTAHQVASTARNRS